MEYVEEEFCNKSLIDLTNCSIEYNKYFVDTTDFKPEAVAVPLTFAFIFLVGVTGNVLLILNFARHKKLSTPHNALVVNLAAGDLLMLVIGLPFNSVLYTVPYWPFGELLCRLSRFAETMAMAVTIATLTVLSVERYFIVTGRRRHHPLSSMPMLVIIAIWAAGFVLSFPMLVSSAVLAPPNNVTNGSGRVEESPEFCFDFNPAWGPVYPQVNVLGKFLLLFVLPLLVITPCYLSLAFHLLFKMFGSRGTPTSKTPLRSAAAAPPLRRGEGEDSNPPSDAKEDSRCQDQRAGSSHSNDVVNSATATAPAAAHSNNATNTNTTTTTTTSAAVANSSSDRRGGSQKRKLPPTRKRRRLAVTVLGLVASFVACWLPRHVFLLWFHFDPGLFNAFWHVFKIFAFCLMFSNSAVNPFVFYVLDLRFRAFVHAVLLCRRRGAGPLPSSGGSGAEENGGGGGGGGGHPETLAVEVSVTDDRKTYIVMSEMPACAERLDAV